MKNFFTLALSLLFFCNAFAEGGTPNLTYVNKQSRLLHPKMQHELAQTQAWQLFLKQHPTWKVLFDEQSGKIHRAYGTAFAPAQTNGTAEQIALAFLQNDLAAFDLPTASFTHAITRNTDKFTTVVFTQNHLGVPILNSEISVRLTKNNQIILFGLDYHDQITQSTTPSISPAQAERIAQSSVLEPVQTTKLGAMYLLPMPKANQYTFALVQEVTVNTLDQNQVPGSYYTLVDVQNKTIVYRQNQVKYCGENHHETPTAQSKSATPPPSEFVVTGNIRPLNQFTPLLLKPMPNIRIFQGLNVYTSDSLGRFSFANSNTLTHQLKLQGKYCRIINSATGNTPSIDIRIDTVSGPILLNGRATYLDEQHISAYYAVNQVHKYFKSLFPTFTGLDGPMNTSINLTSGTCNAFYDGSGINFYAAGGGCGATGIIADVVYHEYGHGIHDKVFTSLNSNTNGALGEGYADIFAITLTLDPVLGIGFFNNTTGFVRRYDQAPKVYPQDLIGEVHADGEIICGAWWNFGQRTNINVLRTVFAEAFLQAPYAVSGDEGKLYTDILIDALLADDNDNNLNNGTPHAEQLILAFARHGITLFSDITTIFVHTDKTFAPAGTNIALTADLLTDPIVAPFLANLVIKYKINNSSTWLSANMNAGAGSTYSGSIPSQPAGTIITYYMGLQDVFGNIPQVYPLGVLDSLPTMPYYILVGMTNEKTEDFENATGWQAQLPNDNATGGKWIIAPPVLAAKTGIIVQPGTNYSAVGTKCAVTGNAPSTTSPINIADVDNGKTTLQSPKIKVSQYANATLAYRRWYTNNQGTNGNADNWLVEISGDSTNWIAVENTSVSDLEWRRFVLKVADYLPTAQNVWVRFVASDTGAGSIVEAAVDEFQIFSTGLVAAQDIRNNLVSVRVYPNPSQSFVNIAFEVNTPQNAQVYIYNALGEQVYDQNLGKLQPGTFNKRLDLSHLKAGIYTTKIKIGEAQAIERIVVY